MYSHGPGVPQDYAEALRWYRKAAEQGDANRQDGLASMYSHGRGVPQDYAEAVRWYRKAADHGYAKAQYNLGNMYYYGRGVPPDRAEAERWYHKAADQGDEYVQRALGLKGPGLSSWGAITLSAMFLGCLWALKDALLSQRSLRHRQPRALTTAGVCGLAYIGLSRYGAFGIFHSALTVTSMPSILPRVWRLE
jgi:TPR repeat protein